ncbi:MAG: hypothetical protein EPO09_06850 [Aquabacterium sp.]|uniref:hypothetical protein n=1 Tax=Aquabacterium sp. TaxID=1872578 RepID=UPI00121C6614|nr:hypothetical protein [Aquabacterium sp.]TAK96029.1 MAG: hypothetical protein EPO09_06850 [Aquabacterium sp.]
MNALLILKLVLVPSLIAGVTIAGRRWGPAVAGWLSAFPVIAGPILLFMALEQGASFTATAAVGTLSAVVANIAFGLAYARTARRYPWLLSVTAGWLAYFLVVAILRQHTPAISYIAPIVLAALLLAPALYPSTPAQQHAPSRPANDLGLRMLAGAMLTGLVTHFAASLGPGLSGMLAMFPVMGTVLTVFTHRHDGSAAAIKLLKGMVLGYYAFSTFCITLAMGLQALPIAPAFLMSFGAAACVQVLSRMFMLRSEAATTDLPLPVNLMTSQTGTTD